MPATIHATAIVDPGAEIGDGTRGWHWVHVSGGARIGRNCSLGQNVFVGNRVVIGDNVKIQNNVSVYDEVTLEDDVFCGPSMVFTNVYNPRSAVSRKDEYRDTLVRRGATLGANCTIVCGVTIGASGLASARARWYGRRFRSDVAVMSRFTSTSAARACSARRFVGGSNVARVRAMIGDANS